MIVIPLPEQGVSWRRTPWLWTIMGASVLVHVYAMLRADPESFILAGALDPKHNLPWTFVTSMFLHGSIGHLVGNMLFLWGVGQPIHHRLGGRVFLAAYLFTGLAAGIAYVLINDSPAIGASGAVSGLMGVYAALWPRRRMRIGYWIGKGGLLRPRAYWALGLWIVLQIWFASSDDGSDRVAYAAHIGGFVAGVGAGLLIRYRIDAGPSRSWMLEDPEPDQQLRAGHLARAVVHNSQIGEAEPMARAWDDWESGQAHVGFSPDELGRVHGDFLRRGDAIRARKAATWRSVMFS